MITPARMVKFFVDFKSTDSIDDLNLLFQSKENSYILLTQLKMLSALIYYTHLSIVLAFIPIYRLSLFGLSMVSLFLISMIWS